MVVADNRSGSAALVTHLVEDHDKRRLFHVDGPPSAPDARERRLGMEQVLRAHPRCGLVGSYRGSFSVQSGEEAVEELLTVHGDPLPDAVVCANDQMAIGVLQAFAKAAVRVPEEVAVAGFDGIYPGSLFDPPLTTVHQPMRLLGVGHPGSLWNQLRVGPVPAEPVAGSLAAVAGAVVDHPGHPSCRGVGLDAHHLPDESAERLDARLGLAAPEDLRPVYVPRGHVLQGAAAVVLVLGGCRPPGRGEGGVTAEASLDRGLLVGRDHIVVFAQWLALPGSGVQVGHPRGLGLEIRVAGEDPRWMPPGADGVLGQPPPDRGP